MGGVADRAEAVGRAEVPPGAVAPAAWAEATEAEELTNFPSTSVHLAVLSKPLHYAADVKLISAAPKIGLIKVERPEFVCWEVDEYTRILAAAKVESPEWYAAICFAGEARLRAGEIRGLR